MNLTSIKQFDLAFALTAIFFSVDCNHLVGTCTNSNLTQLTTQHKRLLSSTANVLDLLPTGAPDVVSEISFLPGVSDNLLLHRFVNAQGNRVVRNTKFSRNYKKADFSTINNGLCCFLETFFNNWFDHSVEEKWAMLAI